MIVGLMTVYDSFMHVLREPSGGPMDGPQNLGTWRALGSLWRVFVFGSPLYGAPIKDSLNVLTCSWLRVQMACTCRA